MKAPVTDCGDNSCLYAPRPRKGMRTNGGCRCDDCPTCGGAVGPGRIAGGHTRWCTDKAWVPEHHRVKS